MPILFDIYRNGQRVESFEPRGACVVGAESVPTEGEVHFVDGRLVVERDDTPLGVALVWDAGNVGEYLLETTRLPARPEPYLLNLELARQRLMKLLQKLEDWHARGELVKDEQFEKNMVIAQDMFARALSHLHIPNVASRLADECLKAALMLSEILTRRQAERQHAARRARAPMSRAMFSCRINPEVRTAKYRNSLAASFDSFVLPMDWQRLQPEEDAWDSNATDETAELFSRLRKPIISGPLVDLSEGNVPNWLYIYEHDFEAIRDAAFQFVKSTVTRYRRVVSVWNVVAGLHASGPFNLSFEQMVELTRLMVAQVKAVNRMAKTLVTIRLPYGEYLAHGSAFDGHGGVPPTLYAEMVAQSGVDCEGFGLEIKTGLPKRGMFCRDLFQISAMLDRFGQVGKPLFISAVACPDQTGGDPDPAKGGRWHRPWDRQLQADWLAAVYEIALSKPFVENIAWADFADVTPMMPGGGLLDDLLRPKPAYEMLQRLRQQHLGLRPRQVAAPQ